MDDDLICKPIVIDSLGRYIVNPFQIIGYVPDDGKLSDIPPLAPPFLNIGNIIQDNLNNLNPLEPLRDNSDTSKRYEKWYYMDSLLNSQIKFINLQKEALTNGEGQEIAIL